MQKSSESPLSLPTRSFLILRDPDLERERLLSLLRLLLCLCLCLSLDLDLLRLCRLCLSRDLSRCRLLSRDRLLLRRLSRSRSRLLSSTSRRPNPDFSSFLTPAPPPLAISSIFASLLAALLTSIVFSNSARFSLILMTPRWSLPPK